MTEDAIQLAETALMKADPLLGKLVHAQKLALSEPREDYFASLARSIIGQQVSVAAARTIAGRFEEKTGYNPTRAAALDEEAIRAIGLSRQKAGYIRDLAQHFVTNPGIYNHLETLSDDEVIAELTAVKGIGIWTAQMFLMFTLARPDVFAPDDAGLQRAMMKLYGWERVPAKKELVAQAEKWQPYRTVACLHLWHSLDNAPV
jgi:DNA-3-methyladenine glycosylase II